MVEDEGAVVDVVDELVPPDVPVVPGAVEVVEEGPVVDVDDEEVEVDAGWRWVVVVVVVGALFDGDVPPLAGAGAGAARGTGGGRRSR
ncbi:MAG TPA: hypothetical protein VFH45_08375 [Acidimicrobiales bacterium]|nr:hypothetical protein [Acidimicrobiales bacterium]